MGNSIIEIFKEVRDPRVINRCYHKLSDILFISFCTILSNGEDFEDMVEFGIQREEWLSTLLELPNGIPSHDTFNRVLQLIDSESFRECLNKGGSDLIDLVKGQLISFDGKKLRGENPTSKGNKGTYILSAWVNAHRLCVGEEKVSNKSNEITAIPKLINQLDLEGHRVSIDAIGCQKEIAQQIIAAKADYLLAVKKNQRLLYEEITDDFIWTKSTKKEETWEYDHGRYEIRSCSTVGAKEVLSPNLLSKWCELTTVVKIEAQRTVKDITTYKTRYYISSEVQDVSFYNNAVREHWGIENNLHWHLDVTFQEDTCRSRSGNAPQNLNILRKLALERIYKMDDKLSLKKRRYRASMNKNYLEKILGVQF